MQRLQTLNCLVQGPNSPFPWLWGYQEQRLLQYCSQGGADTPALPGVPPAFWTPEVLERKWGRSHGVQSRSVELLRREQCWAKVLLKLLFFRLQCSRVNPEPRAFFKRLTQLVCVCPSTALRNHGPNSASPFPPLKAQTRHVPSHSAASHQPLPVSRP